LVQPGIIGLFLAGGFNFLKYIVSAAPSSVRTIGNSGTSICPVSKCDSSDWKAVEKLYGKSVTLFGANKVWIIGSLERRVFGKTVKVNRVLIQGS